MKKRRYSSGRTHVAPPADPYRYTKRFRVVDVSEARGTEGLYEAQVWTSGHGWRYFQMIFGEGARAAFVEKKRAAGCQVETG